MKGIVLALVGFFWIVSSVQAQQKLIPGGMNYLANPKPNTIIYHDSVFTGKKQFMQLFYRTRNQELIQLFERHQSNKVTGQVLGVIGTIATLVGVSRLSSTNDKGMGWVLLGGGFATTLTGGYLTLMGQRNLQMAVTLFNQKYANTAIGIGVSSARAGLVYNF
ncbi:MAG: hypothetical protein KGO92_10080 [Bacteroidota bacterium]|nr:hypothetical protein [Bacteroidota bacterium]